MLKFNVENSVKSSPGPAEISGVIRDSTEKVFCLFSIFLDIHDSNMAEIKVIHKACDIVHSNSSWSDRNVVITSDSKVEV